MIDPSGNVIVVAPNGTADASIESGGAATQPASPTLPTGMCVPGAFKHASVCACQPAEPTMCDQGLHRRHERRRQLRRLLMRVRADVGLQRRSVRPLGDQRHSSRAGLRRDHASSSRATRSIGPIAVTARSRVKPLGGGVRTTLSSGRLEPGDARGRRGRCSSAGRQRRRGSR